MTEQITEITASLSTLDNVSGLSDVAARRLADGDAAFLADLGIALHTRYGPRAATVWQYRTVADRLLRLLSLTPGETNAHQAVRLAAHTGPRRARYAASLIATGHDPRHLTALFDTETTGGDAAGELRACLVQEWVLRDIPIAETPAAAWAASDHRRQHPLGWLPLSLTSIEATPDLPSYGIAGTGHTMPFSHTSEHTVAPHDDPVPQAADTTTPQAADLIAEAVLNWVDESNGSIEARTFDLTDHLDDTALAALLPGLGLECLTGMDGRAQLTVSACPPERAWRLLFAAASSGGAYNSGLHGAYGRLAAWRSLAGLTACATDTAAADVERRVHACAWHTFQAATPWFQQVAWDIGLVALGPDRRSMSVLAATDTD